MLYLNVFKSFKSYATTEVDHVHTSNSLRWYHGWHRAENFSKFVPPDTLKSTPWLCLFLDFFVKHFPNYLSFHFKKLFFVDDFK